ncbi:protein of unknown function [Clostridium beijerinckii]|nr:protein of unknown function [Clostridium beijerinckii]
MCKCKNVVMIKCNIYIDKCNENLVISIYKLKIRFTKRFNKQSGFVKVN